MKNKVFIATSIDGFIADKDGKIDWLHSIPNPDQNDMGYTKFMSQIDAIVMGRTTFETVCSFDIEWPYNCPIYVLSNSLDEIPAEYVEHAHLLNGDLNDILQKIHDKGHRELYIDGGRTIQNFIREDLIDELIITTIPILLGSGTPLFSAMEKSLNFECKKSELFLDKIVQNHFTRTKS